MDQSTAGSTSFEYKVIPAPEKARRARGYKGAALFAHSLEQLINELAEDGWSYLRAEALPQEERSGLTSKTTIYRNLLIFQRPIAPKLEPKPVPDASSTVDEPEPNNLGSLEDQQTQTHPPSASTETSAGNGSNGNLWQSLKLGAKKSPD